MSKRVLILAAAMAATALVSAAMPAFSADSGSVVATVAVTLPPAPCITLSTGAVDFGTQSFSDPAAASTPIVDASPAVHVTSCSTAVEKLSLSASDATTISGAWHISSTPPNNTCSLGPNVYEALYGPPGIKNFFYGNPTPVANQGTLAVGGATDLIFSLRMPCRGSAGAGETATMTFTTLAVLA